MKFLLCLTTNAANRCFIVKSYTQTEFHMLVCIPCATRAINRPCYLSSLRDAAFCLQRIESVR